MCEKLISSFVQDLLLAEVLVGALCCVSVDEQAGLVSNVLNQCQKEGVGQGNDRGQVPLGVVLDDVFNLYCESFLECVKTVVFSLKFNGNTIS